MLHKNYHSEENLKVFFTLIRRLQQKNRFISSDVWANLSIVQCMIILEISTGVGRMSDLIDIFKLNQSTISRHISSLIRKKYVIAKEHKEDARSKILSLTPQGEEYLDRYSIEANKNYDRHTRHLSPEEIIDLEFFFKTVADKIVSPTLKLARSDYPIRREMRRLTHGLGMMSQSFFDSGITVGAWQVLSEIVYNPHRNSQAIITKAFGIPLPTVASIVARLSSDRLVKLTEAKHDARITTIEVTAKGRDKVQSIEKAYIELLSRGVSDIGPKDLTRFLSILEKYIGESASGGIFLDERHVLNVVTNTTDLNALRMLAIKHLSTSETSHALPSLLFHDESICWNVCLNHRTVAIGEFTLRGSKMVCNNLIFLCQSKVSEKKYILEMVSNYLRPEESTDGHLYADENSYVLADDLALRII